MNTHPFAVRGVVEGFYGVFYTHAERDDLLRFLGRHGYNLYVYAPKDDRYHRLRWREPYPPRTLERLGQSARLAADLGIDFCYAISPGLSIAFASADEFALLTAKLRAFYDAGVRAFSLLLDDIPPVFHHAEDRRRYGTYAEAQADLCNRVYAWLIELDASCTLSMCPTDYAGSAPFNEYVLELGTGLHPAIDVFYTGPEVCSRTISAEDARAFGEAVRRAPLIWDNYPVNDAGMVPEMHLGPVRGRARELPQAVRGIVVNPMNQPEASKVALATFARYFADPAGYDPAAAWEDALAEVAGEASRPALRAFGENTLNGCAETGDAKPLHALAQAVLAGAQSGGHDGDSAAAAALDAYLTQLDDACYHLRYEMDNIALRADLLPWIEVLELWVRVGRRALMALRGEPDAETLRRLPELLAALDRHPRRMAGDALRDLATFAQQKGEAA